MTTTHNILAQDTLAYRDERSDKVYTIALLKSETGDAFSVRALFGRRGGTLQQQEWPAADELAARKLYLTKLKEKTGKGYVLQPPPPAKPETVRVLGEIKPPKTVETPATVETSALPRHQLCNPVDDYAAGKMAASGWYMQPKFDGVRAFLRKTGNTVEAVSRTHLPVTISDAVREAALAIGGDWTIDGEMCGDVFFAFDLLYYDLSPGNRQAIASFSFSEPLGGPVEVHTFPYHDRLTLLETLIPVPTDAAPIPGCRVAMPEKDERAIQVTQTWVTPEVKAKALELYRQLGGEGVVFKDPRQRYQAGRPNSGGCCLKLKFVSTATVQVIAKPKEDGKRSVQMAVSDGGKLRDVGTVTIPPNKEIPAIGELIEVRYLYAFRGGSLIQAVYLAPREDKDTPDAYDSLRFKQEPRLSA
jgi:bifunctional non-homologous end joining protein LigD